MNKDLLARLGIAAGALVTFALLCVSVTVPGHQEVFFDACVTGTVSFIGLCAYVMHTPALMAKLQVALAPVHSDRDCD